MTTNFWIHERLSDKIVQQIKVFVRFTAKWETVTWIILVISQGEKTWRKHLCGWEAGLGGLEVELVGSGGCVESGRIQSTKPGYRVASRVASWFHTLSFLESFFNWSTILSSRNKYFLRRALRSINLILIDFQFMCFDIHKFNIHNQMDENLTWNFSPKY